MADSELRRKSVEEEVAMADSELRRNSVEEEVAMAPAGEPPASISSAGLQHDWEFLSLSAFEIPPPPPPPPAFPASDLIPDPAAEAEYGPSLGILRSQHFSCFPVKPDPETLIPPPHPPPTSQAAPIPCTEEAFPIFAESVSRNYSGGGVGGSPFQEEMVPEGGRNEAAAEEEENNEEEEEEEEVKEEPVVIPPAAPPAPDAKEAEGSAKRKEGKIGWLWRSCIEEHSTLWSVALAATVVGLAVLGYSWQKERCLSQDLRMQLSVQEKKISELSYQLANIRDAISGRRKLPVFRSRGAT